MDKMRQSLTGRVLKALSVFGGIEVVTMACAVVRTKLVALWIGAAGVGIISLYNATMEMLKVLTQLNVRQSAVRQIAAAPESERPLQCAATRASSLLIGIVTSIVVAALAPLLSRLTFDSPDYTWGFAALSLTMFATAVASGRTAVLQGLGRLGALARASMWAALTSTAAAIALFYFFGRHAIVPVLMIFPFSTLLFLMLQPVPAAPADIDMKALKAVSKKIVTLGGWLTVASGLTMVADYVLRVYLNAAASIDTVGLFQAGHTIVSTYIGVVFTAISMEFFPRLSASISKPATTRTIVAHEIGVVTAILLPVIIIFISADRLVLDILYSKSFADILPYMSIAVVATTLRGASWCMAYVILAKGDGRAYVLTEAVSCAVMLGTAIPLWHTMGFVGLGLGYIIEFVIYTIVTMAVCRRRYGLRLPARTVAITAAAPLVCAAALGLKAALGWAAPLALLAVVLPFSWKTLCR